ncbi:MAG TPA: hypothetical protein VGD31_14770, partial [Sphingobacteriaceae bacterium]
MRQEKTLFCIFSIISFAILLCIGGSASAQKFSFGFRAGAGISWAGFGDKDQKDTFSTRPVFGYGAAFQVGFPLKNEFQLKLEGGYSREG